MDDWTEPSSVLVGELIVSQVGKSMTKWVRVNSESVKESVGSEFGLFADKR